MAKKIITDAVEPTAPELISRSDAAKLLGIHPVTMKALMERDGFPKLVEDGRSKSFVRAEIEAWAGIIGHTS